MHRWLGMVGVCLLLSANASSAPADEPLPLRVDVFTTLAKPAISKTSHLSDLGPVEVRVHDLATIQRLEVSLDHDLPLDPTEAKRVALERLQTLDKTAIAAIEDTAQSLLLAAELGLEKYPAIVIDRRVVLYGLTDVSRALNVYYRWRREQGE